MSQKIALVWGGTGGHIVPLLSLVAHLKKDQKKQHKTTQKRSNPSANRDPEWVVQERYDEWGSEDLSPENEFFRSFVWIGGEKSMEQARAREAGIRFVSITTYKLTSTKSPGVLLYPFKLLQGIFDARHILKTERPRFVFSKGGPGSVAVGIAAWTLGIPLYIHESDTVPGFSNKVLGHFATRIFLGFEEAKKHFPEHKTTVVGQILHPDFSAKNPSGNIEWKTDKKKIFVSCGSQGSRKVFQALLDQKKLQSSPLLQKERDRGWGETKEGDQRWGFHDTEWIISLGTLNTNMRPEFEKWENTQIFDWIPQADIPHILDRTDIAITRASATTLAELATRPIHLVIIPLAISAGDHQVENARVYEKQGHTVILEQDLEKLDMTEIISNISKPKPWTDIGSGLAPLLALFGG